MYRDYKIDTHTHTLISGHAYNTVNEMILAANKKNMEVLCLTEHGPMIPGGPNAYYFSNLRILPDNYHSEYVPHVIFGMEANICNYNGDTDYETIHDDINDIKYIIASFHTVCLQPSTVGNNTNAYIGAIRKPYVTVLGHIDDGRVPCDYEQVVKAAKKYDVLIEVNNSSNSVNSFRLNSQKNTLEYLQLCKENGNMIVLGSDAHYEGDIGNFSNVIPLLEKVNFPEELIINRDTKLFIDFIEKKYKKRFL